MSQLNPGGHARCRSEPCEGGTAPCQVGLNNIFSRLIWKRGFFYADIYIYMFYWTFGVIYLYHNFVIIELPNLCAFIFFDFMTFVSRGFLNVRARSSKRPKTQSLAGQTNS